MAQEHKLSGVVLVTVGDEVLVERAYSAPDAEADAEPVTLETRFLVASLTKSLVAYLTLRLVEAEHLDLDDPVSAHLPDLAERPIGKATIHHLLTHTSGLPHYEGWPGFLDDVTLARAKSELIERLDETPLRSEPGAAFHYSGPGYLLLGFALEKATDTPLADLLETWVFEALEMSRTDLLRVGREPAPFARPMQRTPEGLRPAPLRHPSTLLATGGVVTTARDLHRFARAIQTSDPLDGPLRETLLTPLRGKYACGLIVYEHPWTRHRFARHKGSMDGVSAHFVFGLEDERVAIALSNVGGAPVDSIDDRLIMRAPRVLEEDEGKDR